MHRGRLVVLALVGATLLSGCVGGDDAAEVITPPETDDGAPAAVTDGGAGVVAPTWSVGDFWVYDQSDGTVATLVVIEETATDWITATASENVAFFDALFDISTQGPQRRSDLAGSQGSTWVEFFRWPLADGATWTTEWDGGPKDITVTQGARGVFEFESRDAEGALHARYSYDPEAHWFRTFDFYAADGSLDFGNTLREWGHDWSGDIVRYTLEEAFQRDSSKELTQNGVDGALVEFTQRADHTDVYLFWDVVCTTGHFWFSVVPGEGGPSTGYTSNGACAKEEHVARSLGSVVGDWGITVAKGTGPDTVWSATIYLRTLETIPFEAGATV